MNRELKNDLRQTFGDTYLFKQTGENQMEQTNKGKFWAVWKENGGATPNKRHDTKESAINEAGRLAQQENSSYYVLETVGIVTKVILPVNYADL